MELKERNATKYGVWSPENETAWLGEEENGLDVIEVAETDEVVLAFTHTAASAEFLSDEIYLELYQYYRTELHRQRETLAKARAEAQARTQSKAAAERRQQIANAPAGAATPRNNGTTAPKPRQSRNELVSSANFTGQNFPALEIDVVPPVAYELISDDFKLPEIIDSLLTQPILAVDTETNGLDPYESKLLLVQIASPEKCYIIDASKVNLKPLKRLLENERSLKILQNAKFDYEMLLVQAGIELNNVYDTYLAERLLTAGLGQEVNLGAIVQRYLNEKMDKSVRKTFYGANSIGHVSPDQLNYAARDVMVLFPIYCKQLRKLKQEKLLAVADLEFKCVTAVGDLELAGCKLDVVKWRKILADVEQKRDIVRTELMEMLPSGGAKQSSMFGGDEYVINLNSQTQIMAQFARLNPPILLEGTSEQELNKQGNRIEVKKLLEYRSLEKTLGSFGEGVLAQIHSKTGRIHPNFLQYGADTGRFSCSNPNVQQIPATSDFRSCFIAEDGYKLVICDYSQCELRVLAELSGDPGFIEAFKSGGDLHKLAASQMFQVAVEDVSKEQRNAAKAINFGLAYGMGAQGLAVRIDKTVDESRALIDVYFKAFSGVQKWLEKAGRDSVRLLYSPTPLGRKRYYKPVDREDPEYRRKMSDIERQGKNAPIQGCVSGSTRIFDKDRGYLPIESLCGEAVSVWDGERFSKATVVYSGKKQLVKVHLWGGHYIECSPDHRFLTRGTAGKDVWKTPEQFKAQDRIVLTEGLGEWSYSLNLPEHSRNGSWNAKQATNLSQITDLTSLGEWLGRIASDGNVTSSCVRLFVAEHEEAILPELLATSHKLGYVGQDVRVTEKQPKRFHRLTISSRGLADQLQQLGIKERIPDCAWQDSRILAGYLRGMFDGDGTAHPDGALLVFGQGEKHLSWAREIQQALLLFGIRSRLNVYTQVHNRINLRIYKKDMPLFCEKIGFMNPEKQTKALQVKAVRGTSTIYGKAERVKLVEVTDQWIDMYDVVNSETERFMANGIVVHNCNADMTKMALVFLREKLKGYDARIVNTVHDEIVVEVREDQAEVVCKLVEGEMLRAGREILKDVPIVADAKIADYWSK